MEPKAYAFPGCWFELFYRGTMRAEARSTQLVHTAARRNGISGGLETTTDATIVLTPKASNKNDDRPGYAADRPAPVSADDPRVIMAAERTLLAWIRTGLAMMGFGFLVAKFGLFMREIMQLQGGQLVATPRWSVWIGAAMVTLGILTTLAAGIEHSTKLRLEYQLFQGSTRGYRLSIACAFLLSVMGGIMVAYLLVL